MWRNTATVQLLSIAAQLDVEEADSGGHVISISLNITEGHVKGSPVGTAWRDVVEDAQTRPRRSNRPTHPTELHEQLSAIP